MSAQTYVLISGATAVQTIAAVPAIDNSNASAKSTNFAVTPDGPDAVSHAACQNQGYQVTVTGQGSVSCTVQPVASNDGINWANNGNTIVVASGSNTSTNIGNVANAPFKHFGAFVTAISGTNAKVSCIMCGA